MIRTLHPDPIGSLIPTQSAELRGLVAEAGLSEVTRALGLLAEREAERREGHSDAGGAEQFRRHASRLIGLAADLPPAL